MSDPQEQGALGQVADLRVQVATLTAKVDHVLTAIPDHELRVRSLEKWRWSLVATAFSSISSLGGVVALLLQRR